MTDIAEQVREQAAKVAEAHICKPGLSDNPAYVHFEPSEMMARKIAAAIRAMPLPAAGWQPIETAPKGIPILVWAEADAGDWVPLVAYCDHVKWMRPATADKLPYEPTHWMPLPAPPEDAK